MSEPTSPRFILVHLRAKSPAGLSRLMLKNNLKHGGRFRYTDPMLMSDGWWYTWYEIMEKPILPDDRQVNDG